MLHILSWAALWRQSIYWYENRAPDILISGGSEICLYLKLSAQVAAQVLCLQIIYIQQRHLKDRLRGPRQQK